MILYLLLASSSLGMVLRGHRNHQATTNILWMSFTHFVSSLSFLQHNFTHVLYKPVLRGPPRALFHFPITQATWHTTPAALSQCRCMYAQYAGKPFTQPHHMELLETDFELNRLTKWLQGLPDHQALPGSRIFSVLVTVTWQIANSFFKKNLQCVHVSNCFYVKI